MSRQLFSRHFSNSRKVFCAREICQMLRNSREGWEKVRPVCQAHGSVASKNITPHFQEHLFLAIAPWVMSPSDIEAPRNSLLPGLRNAAREAFRSHQFVTFPDK